MYVIPNSGKTIRHPHLKTLIPEAGMEVEDTPFFRRRERDGDITIGKPPGTKKEQATETK